MFNATRLLSSVLGALAVVCLLLGLLAMPMEAKADPGMDPAPKCMPMNCDGTCDVKMKNQCETKPRCTQLGGLFCNTCYCQPAGTGCMCDDLR